MNPREELLLFDEMHSLVVLPTCLWRIVFDFCQEFKDVPLTKDIASQDLWLCSNTMALRISHASGVLFIDSSPSDTENYKFPRMIYKNRDDLLLFEWIDTTLEMACLVEQGKPYSPHRLRCERWLQFLCSKLKMKVYVGRVYRREDFC